MDTNTKWRRTVHVYDVKVGGKSYEVRATASAYNGGEWRFTVEGGGNMRRTECDENGATYKRVMKAFRDSTNVALLDVGLE